MLQDRSVRDTIEGLVAQCLGVERIISSTVASPHTAPQTFMWFGFGEMQQKRCLARDVSLLSCLPARGAGVLRQGTIRGPGPARMDLGLQVL